MSWPSLPELAQSIRSGERTAAKVATECIGLIEKNKYFAVLETSPDVQARARQIDDDIASGADPGPLAGIPFLAKDNFLTRECRTTAASRFLRDFQAPYQATAIDRLEAAGAIMLGKTNLDEFAHGSSTENSAFGPTYNPHDETRVPGGSSGGSAAALAAGLAPFTLGTDTGGSIRLPASYCGVVGYKPTYGLVSRYGVIAMASSTDVIGPFARSVGDVAYILNIMAGDDPADATTVQREASYQIEPMSLQGLRIGVTNGHLGKYIDSEVRERTQAALDALAENGAEVKQVDIPDDRSALAMYYIIVPAEISSNLARYDGIKYGATDESSKTLLDTYLHSRGFGFGEEPIRRILTGTYVLSSGYQDQYYTQAQRVRSRLRRQYQQVFEDVDVLIGPTSPTTAFELGSKQDPISMYMTDMLTISANLVGAPAVSLPLPQNTDELPVGLQVVGPQCGDKRLLDIAARVEEVI